MRGNRIDTTLVETHQEVAEALAENRPVVALESTIISHGMPYPDNVRTAREVEHLVRDYQAVPATIAIIDGVYRIGLDEATLERLGNDGNVEKASRRDLPAVFASRRTAATTVATTMIGAYAAGINVFATGGTGGVHRGADSTFDVSADLQELARTPVAVVSAGVKSILDIGKTLEYLETLGVPVLGYRTDEFPAFYTGSSGFDVPRRVDSAEDAARIIHAGARFGMDNGYLIANPIPPNDALPPEYIEEVIQNAVAQAERDRIGGKELTPYLLGRIVELTGGRSLKANIALVKNNARVAAQIAVALSRVRHGEPGS